MWDLKFAYELAIRRGANVKSTALAYLFRKAERCRKIKRLEGEAYVGHGASATPLRNYAPQTGLDPFHFGK